jgi:hypothetical protein
MARAMLPLAEERAELEDDFRSFIEQAWPSIESAPFVGGWVIDALAEHLQAASDGEVKRLLITIPPRCTKTLTASVMFPAWTWARSNIDHLSGPQVKFLCGSYGHVLALQNSNLCRRLILSGFYQRYWGKRFKLRQDQNTKSEFQTDAGGSRLSVSVGGSLLGLGGDCLLIDDPHRIDNLESEAEREAVLQWWKELSSTRLNDPKRAAIVVILQRLHEYDLAGEILTNSPDSFVHLCLPMEYEWRRHCVTVLGWQDPRGLETDGQSLVEVLPDGGRVARDGEAQRILDEEREGALLWPERFGPADIARIKANLGPTLSAGRLQQSPQPRSGGLFKREWFLPWDPLDNKFPPCDLRIASVDSAFTTKQELDPSAMVVLGVFRHPDNGRTRVILMHAWRKHL